MFKNIALIILITFSSICFYSCKDAYTNEFGHVDGLLKILDFSEETLHSVDTTTLFDKIIFLEQAIDKIQAENDTLTKEAAIAADQFIGSYKPLFELSKNYKNYQQEIDLIRVQLTNLKQDLNNGIISKELFSTYYESEQSSVISINEKISQATNEINNKLTNVEENKVAFEELINNPTSYTSYYKNNAISSN